MGILRVTPPVVGAVAFLGIALAGSFPSRALPVASVRAPIGVSEAFVPASPVSDFDYDTREKIVGSTRLVDDLVSGKTAMSYPAGTKLKVPADMNMVKLGSQDATPSTSSGGGACVLHPGRTVTVLGNDPEFGVLIRYDVMGGPEVRECEDKTVGFFAPAPLGRWERVTSPQDDVAARKKRILDAVVRIVGH